LTVALGASSLPQAASTNASAASGIDRRARMLFAYHASPYELMNSRTRNLRANARCATSTRRLKRHPLGPRALGGLIGLGVASIGG
jgi:hypothetical protein